MKAQHLEISAAAAAAGIPGTQLRMWVDRRAIRLDADERRNRIGSKRQFTVADLMRVAFVNELSTHGVPLLTASETVEAAIDFGLMASDPTTPDKVAATFAGLTMAVWLDRRDGRWLWAIEPAAHAPADVPTVTRVDLGAVAREVAARLAAQ